MGDPQATHGTGCNLNRMASSGLAATRSQDEVDAGQSQDVTIRPAFSQVCLIIQIYVMNISCSCTYSNENREKGYPESVYATPSPVSKYLHSNSDYMGEAAHCHPWHRGISASMHVRCRDSDRVRACQDYLVR